MAELSFWDRCWQGAEPERLDALASRLDLSEDPVTRCLRERGAKTVCDAGCGCGLYALKLARQGFAVSGFDVSSIAVERTKGLLSENGFPVQGFRVSDVLAADYEDGRFDAVVARGVLDHMPIRDGALALRELLRLLRPGGCLLLSLDAADSEYESEPHSVNADGDYRYTGGKWKGMVFHPYSPEEIERLKAGLPAKLLSASASEFWILLDKPQAKGQGTTK